MATIFDWVTMALFAALIALFIHRTGEAEPGDTVWHYVPAAAGLALCNWIGNEISGVLALLALGATLVYVYLVLRPFTLRISSAVLRDRWNA